MENVQEHSKLQICNLYRKLQNHKIYFCDMQCEVNFTNTNIIPHVVGQDLQEQGLKIEVV